MALLQHCGHSSGGNNRGAIVSQFRDTSMNNSPKRAVLGSSSATLFSRVIAWVCSVSLILSTVPPALGQSSQSTVPNAPAAQGTAAPVASSEAKTSTVTVPFDLFLKTSHNPFDSYRGKTVPPPNMANSVRLNQLIRDGKIYLTLRDAIDLALEDNLDMVIARYNLPIAQLDVLRGAAGVFPRGVNTGVVSGTPGGAAGGIGGGGAGSGAGAGGTTSGAGGAGAGTGGLVQSTAGGGTSVSDFDPFITAQTYVDH